MSFKTHIIPCICFLFLMQGNLRAENNLPSHTIRFSKDSIDSGNVVYLLADWKFKGDDSALFSSNAYDDSGWMLRNSALLIDHGKLFDSICWFRIHIRIDTSLIQRPLAMLLHQDGASEIYLDGIKIKSFGRILGKDSTVYENPQDVPFIFILKDTGDHLIALRYANFHTTSLRQKGESYMAGFDMGITDADSAIESKYIFSGIFSFLFTLLSAIFFTLFLVHVFMFLYSRSIRSNLYFSLFMLSISGLFYIPYITIFYSDPVFSVFASKLIHPLGSLCSLCFSAFIVELFNKKMRPWIYLVSIVAIISPLSQYIIDIPSSPLIQLLIGSVSLHAFYHIVAAIRRKMKGVWIIGSGILFALAFLITIILISVFHESITFEQGTAGGIIFIIITAMAILSIPISMSLYLAWNFANINTLLRKKLAEVEELSARALEQEREKQELILNQNKMLEQKVEERTAELKSEKKKSDDLLLNILPAGIAEELKIKGESDAQLFDHVTVLFTDFVNFTGISEQLSPKELVSEVHQCFKAFDEITGRNHLEKIKTIGDAYMAVCGLPDPSPEHAIHAVNAALEICAFIRKRKSDGGLFEIRIGIHSGPVVAGIVGVKKFAYDIWGDTVNTAARMEQNSASGRINISETTYELIKHRFECEHRGKLPAKNKGNIDMYFIKALLQDTKKDS